MTLRLHNTMTRRLEEVIPLEDGHVRLYTCGPTVWNRAHIGNFRTFLFEDVLRRVLERRVARVTHVMNLTDVDDRLIANATAHGHTLDEETAPWIEGFFEDLDTLGIRRAHHYPRATQYIDEMVRLIGRLAEHGVTYQSDGSTYFHIADFPQYGRLTGVNARTLQTGASGRIDADSYDKEEARDFALWKASPAASIGWDTPLGHGHPGWHIECSAMSMSLLGESFDIHCGGVDNMFPHHENEIAQSEAATGKPFVRIWCHGEHLRIDEEKMAKSLGNFFTVPDLLALGQRPAAIRYLLIASAHYRKPLNYSLEPLRMAGEQVDRIAGFRDRLLSTRAARDGGEEGVKVARTARLAVQEALDDDLNLPEAMGQFSVAMREANRLLDAGPPSAEALRALTTMVDEFDDVLGVLPLVDREREASLDGETRELLDARARARAERDFARSDALRDQLRERGILVEDTPAGQRWRPAALAGAIDQGAGDGHPLR